MGISDTGKRLWRKGREGRKEPERKKRNTERLWQGNDVKKEERGREEREVKVRREICKHNNHDFMLIEVTNHMLIASRTLILWLVFIIIQRVGSGDETTFVPRLLSQPADESLGTADAKPHACTDVCAIL